VRRLNCQDKQDGSSIVFGPVTLMRKYPRFAAAASRSEEELRTDLRTARCAIAAYPNSDDCVRLGVVENWIAQELRCRTPGLNGPLK
jgi:hypothetical protein